MIFSDFICTFDISEISLILVLHLKTNKTLNDMAKVQIKSEKLTPFEVFFDYRVIWCCKVTTSFWHTKSYHNFFGAPLSFDYKSQKLQEKFGCFDYSAYLCYNNKRKESYMETKVKKIQVHTIDNKDIDKFFPAHSEISS